MTGQDERVVGVLQARVSSRRLPGKVLRPVLGRPLLALQIERLARCETLHQLVLATSAEGDDDPLEELARGAGLSCHRGSLDDVLARVLGAAEAAGADHVVRLTGDCPLIDPALVDRVVRQHLEQRNDYTSNALERTFPDGLDVEVLRHEVLAEAGREARLASEREHVTPWVRARPERFRLGSLTSSRDLSRHRWTVDEALDLAFVESVFAELYARRPDFTWEDVLELVERDPDLSALNAHLPTNAGYARSLAEDRVVRPASRGEA